MSDKVTKTTDEWRKQLDDLTYRVTREAATERPFSHPALPRGGRARLPAPAAGGPPPVHQG